MNLDDFPNLDPTHPNGPRGIAQFAAREAERVREQADAAGKVPADVVAGRQLPAVPSWVQNPEKWVTLDRRSRRAMQREHNRRSAR